MLPKKRKIKKRGSYPIIFSILIGILFLVFVGFLLISNLRMNQKRAELRGRVRELRTEIQLLSERNERLKEGILETEEYDFWEAKLYDFGYKRPGEEAVIIIPPLIEEEIGGRRIEEKKGLFERVREMFGF